MNIFARQCTIEILRILRNPYYVFWSLAMPIVFYFIFTKVVNTNIPDVSLWQAHYLMSMTTFSVMGSAISTLGIRMVQERALGWTTYIQITPLRDSVYFMGKMVGQSMIHLFSITVIFIAGFLINGVSLSLYEWIMCGLWILAASIPFLALGTLIGAMKRADTAAGISNLLFMILAITGGMWMPMDAMPKLMRQIAQWLPSYNFGSGAWEIIRGHSPQWKNILVLASYLLLFMVLSIYIRRKQEVV
ncbi:ABC transporter permease [Falsibacillus albus]|uniref:ABC transporter permease n=1 Tax=Falsibacillus albus TaxID=2478915 RepID=A0A3L7JRB5_9BACI|nr:ABC transporter permease [Falsibacillus albus]RLQ93206.1 ABC transporter permease [Falsibacillus albus]